MAVSYTHLSATGHATDPLDEQRRVVSLQGSVQTSPAAKLLLTLAGLKEGSSSVTLPNRMDLDLDGSLHGELVKANLQLGTPRGSLTLQGAYALRQQRYKVDGELRGLDLGQFIPQDSIGIVSGTIKADGQGFSLSDKHLKGLLAVSLDEVNSVSYTHLDVYKRQDLRRDERSSLRVSDASYRQPPFGCPRS